MKSLRQVIKDYFERRKETKAAKVIVDEVIKRHKRMSDIKPGTGYRVKRDKSISDEA